ncbi:MAG: nitrile hydratase subunit beta [Burkholderiales bacterium]|nr:MAG: nitrile hydratase subunit beta [Burkholderiales bacterium]
MFETGSFVRVRPDIVPGHCRVPLYLKGHRGQVVNFAGTYRNPELLAYHKPGLPARRLYRVRFQQQALWPGYGGAANDTLEADIYEHWLEHESTENQ